MKLLVSVNNKLLEIYQKGNQGKTLLILTGMGCSMDEWYEVTEALSKTNKIIMFHRPGLGNSEIGDELRNTSAVVEEIHQLLAVLEIEAPIILLGHSYGGLCAQHFTKRNPEKVHALILADSTSDDLAKLDLLDLPILNENSSYEEWLEQCRHYSGLDEKELSKIIQPVLAGNQKKLPALIQREVIEFQQKPALYKAMKSEVENWKADAEAIKKLGRLPNTLLYVIGRDKKYAIQQGVQEGLPESELTLLENTWAQLITEQANLSDTCQLIFAENSSHSVHLDQPDLIISIVEEITNGYP